MMVAEKIAQIYERGLDMQLLEEYSYKKARE
jgi:hypothetical protein